ncbi:MAG: hypothetical protein KME40_07350 [Komarekiella atlantica HA4396-MV6]|jgi:hypothetical protein|nr:hypothetical protein [Komarekiella atlantica HA4396-MV6]
MKFQQLELTNTCSSGEQAKAQNYHAPKLYELGNLNKVQGYWGYWDDWGGYYS